MKINKWTKEIESMTEKEAIKKFGAELVEKLLSENAEYHGEDEWYIFYNASAEIPNHNAALYVTYTIDKDEAANIEMEEDYDWSNYSFSVPDWDEEEERIYQGLPEQKVERKNPRKDYETWCKESFGGQLHPQEGIFADQYKAYLNGFYGDKFTD